MTPIRRHPLRHPLQRLGLPAVAAAVLLVTGHARGQADVVEVRAELNDTRTVKAPDDRKSYIPVFDAYLELDPPPFELGPNFNHTTIHPNMADWDRVANWTEANPALADALLEAPQKTLFGLPYGAEKVASRFREADLVAEIAVDGDLRDTNFGYLDALDMIAAYATAESYRLMESGDLQRGLDLAVAHIFFLRQTCDREFMFEQFYNITLLNESLANLRDLFYIYEDEISSEQFAAVATERLPFLRPDRNRLFMPEGDRIVSEALIEEVFDETGLPDREKFGEVFGALQSEDELLTRFGAVRRWRAIAEIHDSKQASLERLTLVYDDWWRRWRVEEYDPILAIPTQFIRTNPLRYAAVLYSIQNIEALFGLRKELQAQAWGTAVAAGICGYKKRYNGNYPLGLKNMYAITVRKISNRDPFDTGFGSFEYMIASSSKSIDTPYGIVEVPAGTGVLWSKGRDNENDLAREHTDDGSEGDIVLWPPIKTLQRRQGLRR